MFGELYIADRNIDEEFSGSSAGELLLNVKYRVQRVLGWKGLVIATMTPMEFARTAVQLFNEQNSTSYTLPNCAEEFVRLGVDLGYVTVLQD